MATTLVSPQEYLNTGYRPEREYVDGELVDRPMTTMNHGAVESSTTIYFGTHEEEWQIRVFTNTRLRTTPTKYRVPDVLVLERPFVTGPAVTEAPAIVIEIVSPDDTHDSLMDRCVEYETLGVRNILIVHPERRTVHLFSGGSLILVESPHLVLALPKSGRQVSLPVETFFARLDPC
jgi:Uma2 family endonuclease